MKNKTIELADGVSVTLKPADGWSMLFQSAITERFNSFRDSPITEDKSVFGSLLWYFVLCASQVVSIEGMDWQPPEIWDTAETLRASFEMWYKVLPEPKAENITLWLNAVADLNSPAVAKELAPGGAPKPGEKKVKKKRAAG